MIFNPTTVDSGILRIRIQVILHEQQALRQRLADLSQERSMIEDELTRREEREQPVPEKDA